MEKQHIHILPLDQWKAVREIEFKLFGVPSILQYYRDADVNKLKQPATDAGNGYILKGRVELPKDELDDMMLEWVYTFDPAATYKTRLLICNTDEKDARRNVDYLPSISAEFLSNPDFSGLSQIEMQCLNGKEFTQFCLDVPIHTYGPLPYPKIRPSAIRTHRWDTQDAEAELIARIRTEISY